MWADEFFIEQVFTNYLTNAINHCDGERIVTISSEKNGDNIRINVNNTGNKIPDDDIDKIWEKFYKVDKARTRAYGGNGIGLSIAKEIVNAHKGTLHVFDNHDKGTKFVISIPKTK